jgi:hypothetical protein
MSEPSSALEQLPLAWQAVAAVGILITTIGGAAYKYVTSLRGDPPKTDHVILERADLADVQALRDLAREFRPAIERLVRIDAVTCDIAVTVKETQAKVARMEQAALVAKEVREGVASALRDEREHHEQPYRRGQSRNRDD